MTGASEQHERAAMNIAAVLSVHLQGTPCRAYKSDMKVQIGEDFYYPDVFVACGEVGKESYSRSDPVVIIEVLSPNTQRYDRGDKRLANETLPSLTHYVLVSQDSIRVEIRGVKAGEVVILDSPDDRIELPDPGFSMSLEALYT